MFGTTSGRNSVGAEIAKSSSMATATRFTQTDGSRSNFHSWMPHFSQVSSGIPKCGVLSLAALVGVWLELISESGGIFL